MKKHLILFLMLLIPFTSGLKAQQANNQPTYTPTVDSILNVIKTATGPELLEHYPYLHKALYEMNDIDLHLKYIEEFAEAARAAKNKKKEAISHLLKVEAMYNYRVADSLLLAESLKALDFMQDVESAEVHYYYIASVIGDIYMLQGNYEEALRYAEKFYEEAKKKNNSSGLVASLQSMGKAYQELDILDKAEESFRESIAAAHQWKDRGMKGESYCDLINMLNAQKRYNDALKVNKEFEIFLQEIDAYNGELKNLCFLSDLGYAASYIKLGQLNLAKEYISKAQKYPIADTDLGMYSVENERFALLLEEAKYAEAEESLDKIESILEDGASYTKAISKIKENRADLYFRWGKYDKAAHIYKEYIAGKDSLQRVEMATKLHTIRTQYEVDKLEMQKEQQKQTLRTTIIWFSVALILLCIIIAVVVLNARRLKTKNLSLLDRIKEQDKLEEENEKMRSELAIKNSSETSTDIEETDKLGAIYLKLRELMKDPDVFTDPNVNRKIIAEKLGTNEKYLFDTIREYYGVSISDYITGLRLGYARNLLARPLENRTIEAIAFEAGFSSRTSFHRLFKDHYGMTPAEFRQLVTAL